MDFDLTGREVDVFINPCYSTGIRGSRLHIMILLLVTIPQAEDSRLKGNHDPWPGLSFTNRWVEDLEGKARTLSPTDKTKVFSDRSDPDLRKWHVDMAITTAFSKLSSTEQKLDRKLDIPLKFDFLNVFERPRTPIDRKSSFSLNAIYFGLGKRVSDKLILNWYFGFGPGVDRDHQRFLTADLRVNFKYDPISVPLRTIC